MRNQTPGISHPLALHKLREKTAGSLRGAIAFPGDPEYIALPYSIPDFGNDVLLPPAFCNLGHMEYLAGLVRFFHRMDNRSVSMLSPE
jgi:hypothetical protein